MADLSGLLGPYYRPSGVRQLNHLVPDNYVLERDREEAGLEAPPISPDDFLGAGSLKAAGAGAVSLASLLGLAKMAGKGGPKMYPNQAGAIKPLTEKEFYRNYVQHLDIRGRATGTQAENLAKIQEEGFKLGRSPNALPPARGGRPLNIIDEKFAPKAGDYVYLAPKEYWKNKPSGLEIQSGWKPAPNEVVVYRDEDVGKSAYQMYLEALERENR